LEHPLNQSTAVGRRTKAVVPFSGCCGGTCGGIGGSIVVAVVVVVVFVVVVVVVVEIVDVGVVVLLQDAKNQ